MQPPNSHHLEAAQGWLELGNHEEANEELELIDAPLRSHPDVLEARWGIYAKGQELGSLPGHRQGNGEARPAPVHSSS